MEAWYEAALDRVGGALQRRVESVVGDFDRAGAGRLGGARDERVLGHDRVEPQPLRSAPVDRRIR